MPTHQRDVWGTVQRGLATDRWTGTQVIYNLVVASALLDAHDQLPAASGRRDGSLSAGFCSRGCWIKPPMHRYDKRCTNGPLLPTFHVCKPCGRPLPIRE